jgi:hypothetical protein
LQGLSDSPNIPRLCKWLVKKTTKNNKYDAPSVDDLEERFKERQQKFGVRRARWIYRWDAIRTAGCFLLERGLNAMKALALIYRLFHWLWPG